jgi:hypothetical protein
MQAESDALVGGDAKAAEGHAIANFQIDRCRQEN